MKRRFLLGLFTALALPLVTLTSCEAAARSQHVFIVSFDGGKPEVMRRSAMPTLFDMGATGATTWNAQTIFPSITLPSHTSMLTGVVMEKHKISWNDWQPARGVVTVPTIFKIARDNGYTTGLFAGKEKFRHLNLPGSVDDFQVPSYSAKVVAAAAAKFIIEKKPNLTFIHFADSDGAGHAHGWGSPEQVQAFVDEDAALKILRDAVDAAGLSKKATFILTADHGGHDKTHGSNSPEDMTIPWITWGAGVKPKTEIAAAVNTCDTAATALWLLDLKVPEGWDGKPVTSAYVDVP
ncbi:MAG TPA: alkaline phosphatase family protein [Abditibacteriaceae bacterium]|jgi:predicted AlkP superfamily pyrophosphatase or phosphodiesterase